MKRILSALLFLVCSAANAQFVTGQILTAAQLNAAFANVLATSGGTLTGPLTVQGNTTVANLTVNGTFTAPGALSPSSLTPQIPNSVIGNVSNNTQSPGVVGLPSCASNTNALIYTNGAGFTCNTNINASTLGGQIFAAPGPIGSSVASTGSFTTLAASGTVSGAGFTSLLSPYAPLASPTFTGVPAAPTATSGTNTTQLSTTQFVTAAVANATGRLIGLRAFTATTTYTPTAGTNSIVADCVGAGGAGGSIPATTTGQVALAGAGAAGGRAYGRYTTGFSGVTITIGAGGTPAAAGGNAGGPGGTTTFGALLTANGGSGGTAGAASSASIFANGTPGGTATGGTVNINGMAGPAWFINTTSALFSARGADSTYGWGGGSAISGFPGNSGTGQGSGGSGAISGASASAQQGGAGAGGICIVSEYQ